MLVLCDKYQGELNGQLMAGVSDVTSGKTKQAKDSMVPYGIICIHQVTNVTTC